MLCTSKCKITSVHLKQKAMAIVSCCSSFAFIGNHRKRRQWGKAPTPVRTPHWWEQVVILGRAVWHAIIWGISCHHGLKPCCYCIRRLAQSPHLIPNSLASPLLFHQQPTPRFCQALCCGPGTDPAPKTPASSLTTRSLHFTCQMLLVLRHRTLKSGAFAELKREI